jgi:hypothetical protein
MTRGYGFPIATFGNDKRDGHDKGRRCLADARHDKKKVGMTKRWLGMTRRVTRHDDFTVIPDSFLPVIPDLIGDPGFSSVIPL